MFEGGLGVGGWKGGRPLADPRKVCKALLDEGKAERVSGEAIHFRGEVNPEKLAKVRSSYADAFYKRWQKRTAKEREAQDNFHDFRITY